jgi:hypothetical protein
MRSQLNGLKELSEQTHGAKVYRALLSQSGTDAPEVQVLVNTFGVAVNWTRDGAGLYIGALASGALDPARTFHRIHSSAIVDYADGVAHSRIESGSLFVQTVVNDSSVDGQLTSTPVELVEYA